MPPLSRARIAEIRQAVKPYPDPCKWVIYAEDVRDLLAELDRRDALVTPEARVLAATLRDVAKRGRRPVAVTVLMRKAADLLDAFLAGSRADTEE